MKGLIKKYKKAARFDVSKVFFKYFNQQNIKKAIADLNREQLADGKDSNDVDLASIGGDYAAYTIEYKQAFGKGLGAVIDRVTLYDTGDFHKGIIVKVSQDEILIIGTDPKTEKLKRDWGNEIIGVKNEALKEIISGFRVYLLATIRGEVL